MTDPIHDPIELVDAAMAATNREDWHGVAALCDPASLAAFRRHMLDRLDPATIAPHEVTAESLQHGERPMPREVAEQFAAWRRERNDPVHRLREEFPDVASTDELRAMAPAELFAAWLDGRSARRQILRLVAEGRAPAAVAEHLRAGPFPSQSLVALGVVHDGERFAHVLYRHRHDAEPAAVETHGWAAALPDDERELALELMHRGHPQVTTCRRQPDGSWRLIADHNLLGYGFMAVGSVTLADEVPPPGDG